MAPFYGWGSTASRLEPLRGGSLLFTTKFPPSKKQTLQIKRQQNNYILSSLLLAKKFKVSSYFFWCFTIAAEQIFAY